MARLTQRVHDELERRELDTGLTHDVAVRAQSIAVVGVNTKNAIANAIDQVLGERKEAQMRHGRNAR
ncbi:MAG: hypothetical protein ACE5EF_00045 [Dehalococcoidia bacterium]